MGSIVAMLLAIIAAAALIIILMVVTGMRRRRLIHDGMEPKKRNKSEQAIIKDCIKKITQDPNNVPSLLQLSDIYYEQEDYEKAMPLYNRLYDLSKAHMEIPYQKVALRHGICCFKMGKTDDAGRSFVAVLKDDPKVFEANLYLGKVFYDKKDYEKSIMCLKRAYVMNQNDVDLMEYMGKSLYELKKYKEAAGYLKKGLELNPANKEIMFLLACSLKETSFQDQALKIFMHLRPDPTYGAESCMSAAAIHERQNQPDKAVEDYEIALKIETITKEKKVVVMYKLANNYIQKHNLAGALNLLRQIQAIVPNYKDVDILIRRYQELNQNSNLQVYLLSSTNDFTNICKQFVSNYYRDAKVKFEEVQMTGEGCDIMCQVFSDKWEDLELFRFFRSTGSVGEFNIRSFHSKMKEIKVDRGYCVTAGSFSDETRKFVEGRPIDLIDKPKLVALLKRIEQK